MTITITIDATAGALVTDAFLVVSVVSLLVQMWALHRLHQHPSRGGLYRTAACRVGCAVVYVAVGVNAMVWHWATLQISLAAFALTQATWQANAVLDVRQGRRRMTERLTI